MALDATLAEYTAELERKGLLRTRAVADSEFIHFDSNDYLSLSEERSIAQAYERGFAKYPTGSGGSMLLSGYHASHQALERSCAQWLGVDECLLCSSGYAANLAVTALLGALKTQCLIDKAVHASIYDGLSLAQTAYTRYLHNDMSDLKRKLAASSEISVLITEGIFSMSGQIAPLMQISELCAPQKVDCIVDEAHSIGVIGCGGRGAVAASGLGQQEIPLRVIPLGKAFAAQGALIAGKASWIQALMQAGRSLIYSTALSPALSYGLLNTLDYVAAADDRRLKLLHLIDEFRNCIKHSPLIWTDSQTAIQQLQLGSPHLAVHYAQALKKLGFSCSAIRTPTVSAKASGLRIIINYRHEPEDFIQLFKALNLIYESAS